LGTIPFVYLNDWPVERNKVRLAWTMGNQRQYVTARDFPPLSQWFFSN
jgi:hypothetical protein